MAPLLVSVEKAAEMLSISRKQVYREMASGKIKSVLIGKRRLIPTKELERYVGELRERAA